jgi:hypothetical protein
MDHGRFVAWLLPVLFTAGAAAAEPIPKPDFDRVDYAHPERYLAIEPALGSRERATKIADAIGGRSSLEKLRGIHRWIVGHLGNEKEKPYRWRTLDQIVADGTTNGNCADTAVVFGVLARAIGIPTVWVKTMDVDWIWEFAKTPELVHSRRGHVFLELFLDGKWKLLDATNAILYDDYDTRAHVLPGNRWAYDKGGDPFAMLMSSHGDAWSRQTDDYFRGFDTSRLPVGAGRSLERTVHIVGDMQAARPIIEKCRSLGLQTISVFTLNHDHWLANARGNWLILPLIGDKVFLPERYWTDYSPAPLEAVKSAMRQRPSGHFDRALDDGTRVILIFARDTNSFQSEVDKLVLSDAPKPTPPNDASSTRL